MGRFANALACAWLALCLAACAEGFSADPVGVTPRPLTSGAGGGASAGMGGGGGSGGSGGTGGAPGVYTGEACAMGQTSPCSCATGGMGTKTCRFDRASPTMGTFSECEACMTGAAGMPVDPGDVMTSGTGGSGGRAGTGGTGGTGGRSGSGGTGAAGTGGTGGTAPRPPTSSGCSPACSQPCFPIGVLPCCRINNTCGCTWAPGAYCL